MIYNNYWGMSTTAGGSRKVIAPLFYNNTLYANLYALHVNPDAVNAQVINNIFYQTSYNANSGTDTIFSNNLCSSQTAFCSTVADPQFVNAVNLDFRLQLGSPAIDKGIAQTKVPKDAVDVARPQGLGYDLGAYEFYVALPTAPITAPKNLKIKQ